MPRKTTTTKPSRKTSLAGLVGHTYVPDEQQPDRMRMQFQFEIIRPVPPGRWLVQLFSFMDGRPTNVVVYPESFLLGETVKLYLSHDEWHYAHERESQWRREERTHELSVAKDQMRLMGLKSLVLPTDEP